MERDRRPPDRARGFFDLQARSLIKDLREQKQLTYKELAQRLEAQGTVIDVRVLINRVNNGKYSFSFALQLLAAMNVPHIPVPQVHEAGSARKSHSKQAAPPPNSP